LAQNVSLAETIDAYRFDAWGVTVGTKERQRLVFQQSAF